MHTAPARPDKQPHLAVELVGLAVRAFAAALLASFVLGALVLLLAGPVQAQESRPTVSTGGLSLRGAATSAAAPLLETEVTIQVSGPLARTRVVQRFRNPAEAWLEGVYAFPLPENAAVDSLRMQIGERLVEGEIREREAAQAAYDRARSAGQRASLVEQSRPNLFTTRVANIGPQEEIRIEIEYQQTLAWEEVDGAGRYRLRFPMVVGPRYIPGTALAAPTDPGAGWSPDTDRVPDASRITPPVLPPGSTRQNPLRLTVVVDAGAPIARIESLHHAIDVRAPDVHQRVATLARGTVPADRDFELEWSLDPVRSPSAVLFADPGTTASGRSHALLMLIPPSRPQDATRLPREVVFVLDTSGSMHGASIEQARAALVLALQRLKPEDRFNIIEFNSVPRALFDEARPADGANVARASAWVQGLEANGGTEMLPALERALDAREEAGRVRQVIFLTDGAVANEDELFALIERRLGDSRLFTIGIGSAPNSHFMRKAAESGRGTFTYIGRVDTVQARMEELFRKLETPVLKGITVRWSEDPEADQWPRRIPDLYLGEPLLVSAALARAGGEVVVNGRIGTLDWSSRIRMSEANPGHGVGKLWARHKIGELEDTLHDGSDETLVRQQIVALALEHHLVSRHTSLVAVDRTPARPQEAKLASSAVPTHLPDGWKHEAVFGELPRGASGLHGHALFGALALLLAAALHWRRPGRRSTARRSA